MSLNRRASLGMLAAAAVSAPAVLAQPASPQAPQPNDPGVQAARQELQDNARRIAQVTLPRATEPAFSFRAH